MKKSLNKLSSKLYANFTTYTKCRQSLGIVNRGGVHYLFATKKMGKFLAKTFIKYLQIASLPVSVTIE